jgi:ATP-binding cassette subfamily C exporter for protease/lipase
MSAPAKSSARLLGRSLWEFRREFFWVGVFSFFANLLMLTPTLYLLQVFDRVLVSGSELTLAALTLIAVFFFLVMGFAEWVRSRLLVRAGARFDEALNSRVFKTSFVASLRSNAGRPMQAFADLTNLRQFLTGNGVFAFFDLPWLPVYLVVLFLMHPWLGWASIAMTLLLAAVAIIGQRLTAPRHAEVQDAQNDTNAYLWSKLRNAETVHALGMLPNLRRHWTGLQHQQSQRQNTAQASSQRLLGLIKFLQVAQPSLILAIGALLAIDGKIGVGAVIASNALMANALRPIGVLVGAWKQFVEARQSYRRLDEMLASNPERDDDHAQPDSLQGQVTLRDLSALVPGRERPILDQLQAEFKAGEVVAIVGPSGAGKSTLARCLVGVWPSTSGQVLLDGVPIEHWSREALGPHLGYLPQDIELLDGTIAENIARFGPVDAQQVIEAATRTGIHEMVLRFPKGYDTPMGEAGNLLSGGQRQRVGLARALYGDPSLLVLDEPNANLDDIGEAALVRAVRDLKARGKTVFMIVHQRHLLAAADRVLVLENGRIKTLGSLQAPTPQNPAPQIEVRA